MPSVVYPPQIKKDKDKLFACYSLIEQMRLEYNKVSAIAASDKEAYAGKFLAYSGKATAYLEQLLAERNGLIEKIRWANYTPKQWEQVSQLPIDQYKAVNETLFGIRRIECVKPTLASSPLLDELKAIDITKLSSLGDADPTEDFTTYTEVDPNSNITKTADRITFTNFRCQTDTAYVYKDKSATPFNGSFEHRLKWTVSSFSSINSFAGMWIVSNDVADIAYQRTNNMSHLGGRFYRYMTSEYGVVVEEQDGSSHYEDAYANYSVGTVYYCTFKRDEGVGTYGTIYFYLCTGNYYGGAGSSLIDTMSIALHTSKKDYIYIYGLTSYDDNNNSNTITGYIELLDLQEGGGQPTMRRWGGSILPIGAQRIGKGW